MKNLAAKIKQFVYAAFAVVTLNAVGVILFYLIAKVLWDARLIR